MHGRSIQRFTIHGIFSTETRLSGIDNTVTHSRNVLHLTPGLQRRAKHSSECWAYTRWNIVSVASPVKTVILGGSEGAASDDACGPVRLCKWRENGDVNIRESLGARPGQIRLRERSRSGQANATHITSNLINQGRHGVDWHVFSPSWSAIEHVKTGQEVEKEQKIKDNPSRTRFHIPCSY
ncbi:hypothetical protein BDV37DRAFT_290015 [Aspergillus pseudonomiae]|uniref:Uncharacterized protein n=1 Tax=Aspergillus pseudonomiae TaxID=1506151 RepID=A0A5N7CT63_9EURO|nr:uncharacterized protein BDV37DRAFT_290015 [Aspergillus pseudonomiae]KAE8396763.1 hypothetical protein BDV37DRAFT_290015 [Aspergillus pseudonomiae]